MLFSFYLKDHYLGRRPIPMGTRPAPKVCAVAKLLFHFDGQAYRCEDEVAAMDIGNLTIDIIEIEYDTIDSFPFMLASMSISFGEAQLIGADPLE